ncbi:MAG: DUF2164 domain-containing protein [Proteobacteria bacterium]|nr:DUF2164 domain-containing protein [Pseudomonadota bacterium]
MSEITFSKEEKSILVDKLKMYFDKELGQEVGQFDCEFFLDFISAEIGSYYYNKGLSDAQSIVTAKMEDISDAFYEIEKPTNVQNR